MAIRQSLSIGRLQEKYLQTRDPKDLETIYKAIVALGLTLQRKVETLSQDPDDVFDIASNVCMRLMEQNEMIIRSAPSAYMKLALFYKNKGSFHDSLDEKEIASWDSPCEPTYEEHVEDSLVESEIDVSDDVGALVRETLLCKVRWKSISRCIKDPNVRKEYERQMMEVYQHEKKNLQSARML